MGVMYEIMSSNPYRYSKHIKQSFTKLKFLISNFISFLLKTEETLFISQFVNTCNSLSLSVDRQHCLYLNNNIYLSFEIGKF